MVSGEFLSIVKDARLGYAVSVAVRRFGFKVWIWFGIGWNTQCGIWLFSD
jgi:hypothetical protein